MLTASFTYRDPNQTSVRSPRRQPSAKLGHPGIIRRCWVRRQAFDDAIGPVGPIGSVLG